MQIRDADISARKRAELRVRESEERARSIIESTNEAFLAGDLDGTVMEWNRGRRGDLRLGARRWCWARTWRAVLAAPARRRQS